MATARLSSTGVRSLVDLLDADPATVDLSPLRWLDDVIGDARVVAIGESAHFNAESYRLRHLVVRYLVEEHGFTAHAMESGFVEGWAVDAWIADPGAGGVGTGAMLAGGLTSLMGMWREQRDLLQWLKSARSRSSRIHFYGVDLPSSVLAALDFVTERLVEEGSALQVEPRLRELAAVGAASSVFTAQDALAEYAALTVESRRAITAGLSLLLSRIRVGRPAGRRLAPPSDRAEQALLSAVALDAFRWDMRVNVRDRVQADLLGWVLEREERVVLAAHNSHVQRWPAEFPGLIPASRTLGQYLDDRLGEQYRVIGMTTGRGRTLSSGAEYFAGQFFENLGFPPDGTLDAVLDATAREEFGVDLRALDTSDRVVLDAVRHQRSGGFLCPIDPLVAYDALVHLPHVTEATADPDALAAAPPEVVSAFRRWAASTPARPE